MRPTEGEILLKNEQISGLRAHQIVERGIIQIPQGDLLFSEMTVFDNLMMGAYLPDAYKAASQRMKDVFELLPRLEERRDQIASTLSGGERRMLSIGRGLMGGGKLLLVDEPSLGLAPLIIDQIYDVITDLKRRGVSILLVEENASRAMEIADHVYLLDDGRVVWQGAPADMAANEEILATYLGG
jgi:branched-chain amino acid transport system ATP-binding protein